MLRGGKVSTVDPALGNAAAIAVNGYLAKASDIARAALFLASDESSYVNCTTFLVDGGIASSYVTAEDPEGD